MTKFIKVNEQYDNNQTYPLLINCNCIRTIKMGEKGKDTMIYLTNDKYYFVKESVEEIWLMLNDHVDVDVKEVLDNYYNVKERDYHGME